MALRAIEFRNRNSIIDPKNPYETSAKRSQSAENPRGTAGSSSPKNSIRIRRLAKRKCKILDLLCAAYKDRRENLKQLNELIKRRKRERKRHSNRRKRRHFHKLLKQIELTIVKDLTLNQSSLSITKSKRFYLKNELEKIKNLAKKSPYSWKHLKTYIRNIENTFSGLLPFEKALQRSPMQTDTNSLFSVYQSISKHNPTCIRSIPPTSHIIQGPYSIPKTFENDDNIKYSTHSLIKERSKKVSKISLKAFEEKETRNLRLSMLREALRKDCRMICRLEESLISIINKIQGNQFKWKFFRKTLNNSYRSRSRSRKRSRSKVRNQNRIRSSSNSPSEIRGHTRARSQSKNRRKNTRLIKVRHQNRSQSHNHKSNIQDRKENIQDRKESKRIQSEESSHIVQKKPKKISKIHKYKSHRKKNIDGDLFQKSSSHEMSKSLEKINLLRERESRTVVLPINPRGILRKSTDSLDSNRIGKMGVTQRKGSASNDKISWEHLMVKKGMVGLEPSIEFSDHINEDEEVDEEQDEVSPELGAGDGLQSSQSEKTKWLPSHRNSVPLPFLKDLESGVHDSDLAELAGPEATQIKKVFSLLLREKTPTDPKDLWLLKKYGDSARASDGMLQQLHNIRLSRCSTAYQRILTEAEFGGLKEKMGSRLKRALRSQTSLIEVSSADEIDELVFDKDYNLEAMLKRWQKFFDEQVKTPFQLELEKKRKIKEKLEHQKSRRSQTRERSRFRSKSPKRFDLERHYSQPRLTARQQKVEKRITQSLHSLKSFKNNSMCSICGLGRCSSNISQAK
ncbi:uncharacterized protein PFB0145c-like [Drosophila eugracilis]|uniref:uncharacterized protein PFB0145c-like n=1 Tax=Drosophila eugracilis TaxID=29029 RepID=UPI001BDB4205|nr:uncharacterized protein PFB0145c-like [Drosophila eugracilis]